MSVVRNKTFRVFLFSIGLFSTAIGIVGAFVPLLPTTPFILLAAWCFLRSSARAHQWLSRQPVLGTALKQWEESRSISPRAKLAAIGMISLSAIVLWSKPVGEEVKISVTILLMGISLFIATGNSGA